MSAELIRKATDNAPQIGMVGATIAAVAIIDPPLTTFEHPKVAVAGVILAVGGIALDRTKDYLENRKENKAVPIADPEIASAAGIDGRFTRIAEKAGYYTAVGLASFGVVHTAGPYRNHSNLKGTTVIALEASYAAEVQDMDCGDGKPVTRLESAVNGSIAAAKDTDVPFTFMLAGSTAKIADVTPAEDKDLGETREDMEKLIQDPVFRNGRSIDSAVEAAAASSKRGGQPNKIIMVAASLTPDEAASIRTFTERAEETDPEDNLYVVVTGKGKGQYQIGGETLESPIDPQGLGTLVGTGNVRTAGSCDDVENAIKHIIQDGQVADNKQPSNFYGNFAILSGLLLSGVAGTRRLSGMSRLGKRLTKGNK